MTRMWLLKTIKTPYYIESAWRGERLIRGQWIDVDTFEFAKPYCISEQEYALRRLAGEPL